MVFTKGMLVFTTINLHLVSRMKPKVLKHVSKIITCGHIVTKKQHNGVHCTTQWEIRITVTMITVKIGVNNGERASLYTLQDEKIHNI